MKRRQFSSDYFEGFLAAMGVDVIPYIDRPDLDMVWFKCMDRGKVRFVAIRRDGGYFELRSSKDKRTPPLFMAYSLDSLRDAIDTCF